MSTDRVQKNVCIFIKILQLTNQVALFKYSCFPSFCVLFFFFEILILFQGCTFYCNEKFLAIFLRLLLLFSLFVLGFFVGLGFFFFGTAIYRLEFLWSGCGLRAK